MFRKEVIAEGYADRWHIIPRNRWFNVYLHRFVGPAVDPIHTHPWAWNLTLVLWGAYREERLWEEERICSAGRAYLRIGASPHRILELLTRSCWTLFVTGPWAQPWGFLPDTGTFVPWRTYLGLEEGQEWRR